MIKERERYQNLVERHQNVIKDLQEKIQKYTGMLEGLERGERAPNYNRARLTQGIQTCKLNISMEEFKIERFQAKLKLFALDDVVPAGASRLCRGCNKEKHISLFISDNVRNKRKGHCLSCRSEDYAAYRAAEKERRAANRVRERENRAQRIAVSPVRKYPCDQERCKVSMPTEEDLAMHKYLSHGMAEESNRGEFVQAVSA